MFLDVDRKYELSDALFWDTRPELVNAHKHRVQIIERVLTRGSMNEFRNILHYYGKNGVRESIKSIQYLDDKTMRFCNFYFKLPFEEMRCYVSKQTRPDTVDF
jgi:hypothetical protein